MILTFGCLYLALAVAVSAEGLSPTEEPSAFHYHRRVGIPKATEIKKWEDENVGKLENERIIGGWAVDISRYPYQAGLVIQVNWVQQSVCGACLISNSRLVTAAHCQNDRDFVANSFTVVLGSNFIFSGGRRIVTRDVVVHPTWNHNTLEADIAVIRIPSISFTNVIQPINLPSGNELSLSFAGWTGTASGFGYTSNGAGIPSNQRLRAVTAQIITHAACNAFYGHWARPSNICISGAGIRGICHGDSGGPLMVQTNNRRILVGVASYGSWHGCQNGDPSAFARVTSFVNWIRTI